MGKGWQEKLAFMRKFQLWRFQKALRRNQYTPVEIEQFSARFTGTTAVADVIFKHPDMHYLATKFAKFFQETGGVNFVEMLCVTQGGQAFTLTVAPRNPGVPSPGEVVGKLRCACELAHRWFEDVYPEDVFTGESVEAGTVEVVEIRTALREAMAMYPDQT